jgi:serine/threonine protein kinase
MSKTPLFPGDTEGLQLLEQISIIGSPTDSELHKLSAYVDENCIKILKRSVQTKPLDLRTLLAPHWYSKSDVEQAADLLSHMLKWVPNQRISAADAMLHPFLADTKINAS